MNESDKFMRMFGGIFFAVGIVCLIISIVVGLILGEWMAGGIMLIFGLLFGTVGGGILLSQLKRSLKRKNVEKNGIRYSGKIYGYVEDKSCTMNDDYLINIKVHYFDNKGIEREAVIRTGFTRGSGDYPIGATIDIIALGSEYSWDKNSVRYEKLAREEELMDDKPLDPMKLNMVAVTCPGCGATFSAAKGYVSRCPYCDRAVNNFVEEESK